MQNQIILGNGLFISPHDHPIYESPKNRLDEHIMNVANSWNHMERLEAYNARNHPQSQSSCQGQE